MAVKNFCTKVIAASLQAVYFVSSGNSLLPDTIGGIDRALVVFWGWIAIHQAAISLRCIVRWGTIAQVQW